MEEGYSQTNQGYILPYGVNAMPVQGGKCDQKHGRSRSHIHARKQFKSLI